MLAQAPQGSQPAGSTTKFASLTAQLKYDVKEADKKKGLLSDGEPIVAQPDKGSAPTGGQLADKAFDQLKN